MAKGGINNWVRTFEVTADTCKGEGKGGVFALDRKSGAKKAKRTWYDITSVVYAEGFPETATRIVVRKRFSQIRKFHTELAQIHKGLYLKGQFPTFPKVSYFNRFQPEVIEERRAKTKEMLEFSGLHRQLFNSQVFADFFTPCSPNGGQGQEDEEDSEDEEVEERSKNPVNEDKVKVTELRMAGNVMDAAALSLHLAKDQTPTLSPAKHLKASKSPSPRITPTTPDEEMMVLPDYLSVAAEDVSRAVQLEIDDKIDESIECYRSAIGTLLSSVQQDRCLKRQASVKRRIEQYILKAESLVSTRDLKRDGSIESINEPTPLSSSASPFPHLDLFGDIVDLKKYKVINVVSNKVLLARDIKSEETKVVIKAIQKSPVVVKANRRKSLLPVNIPFMTPLIRYYETDETLFLILKYFDNGQLYEAVEHIFQDNEEKDEKSHVETDLRPKSPVSANVSVIKPSPSFVDKVERIRSDSPDNGNFRDMDIVHKVGDKNPNLLCVNEEGIEKIDCGFEEGDDEFDFMSDCADEKGEELDEDFVENPVVAKSEKILASIGDKLKDNSAQELLSKLDQMENNLLRSHLDGRCLTPMASPFKRPGSSRKDSKFDDQNLVKVDPIRSLKAFKSVKFRPGTPLPTKLLRQWSAQLCHVVFDLHDRGIIIQDLNPRNLLLDECGNLFLTYQCEWVSVDRDPDPFALACFYTAPEVSDVRPLTPACDWWSVGVILYELATGRFFADVYPSGIRLHTPVEMSETEVDHDLADLISQFLHPMAEHRLGSRNEKKEISRQNFFQTVQWSKLRL